MIGRIITLLVAFLAAVLLVTIAVANRHTVTLVLDPFNPDNPIISLPGQFFLFLFGMLIAGVVLGGVASWMGQGKWRRTARQRTQEAMRWKA